MAPLPGSTHKTLNIKIPQIARWRIAGVTDRKIAELLNMGAAAIGHIVASQEYQEYEAALLNGHLTSMDRALAGKVAAINEEMRSAVPAAVRCLVETVTQRRDLKAAMAAAKEILDRDPDRSLPSTDGESVVAPGVPAEVIAAAAAEGNKIAAQYGATEKKVN